MYMCLYVYCSLLHSLPCNTQDIAEMSHDYGAVFISSMYGITRLDARKVSNTYIYIYIYTCICVYAHTFVFCFH